MAIDEFIALCREQREAGRTFVVLVATRKREPKSDRVRLFRRFTGMYVGWQGGDRYAFSVNLDDVLGPAPSPAPTTETNR